MSVETNYDFIVVGAGSAGCVLAARLSERPDARVLLLEAGSQSPSPTSSIPPAWPALLATECNWGDSTTTQAATGQISALPRGRGIGGSSAINAMVFARGHRASYDSWENFGAFGWDFDSLLPYFKRSETAVSPRAAHCGLRGGDGPLHVRPADPPNAVIAACLEAAVECGYERATDISGGLETGFATVDLNIVDGKRQSAADAYLNPALERPNLDFIGHAAVHRLRVPNGRCTAVEYTTEAGTEVSIASAGEVILTAGTIGSPQLLLRSGIGPQSHLCEVGIDVAHHLPGVGANLHDHPLAVIAYGAARPVPREEYNHCEAIGLIYSGITNGAPNLQILFVDAGLGSLPGVDPTAHGYGICVAVMQPFSRGTVRLSGPEVTAAPVINPNYFGDDRDMKIMIAGLRLARNIGASTALESWRDAEVAPGPDLDDDDSLRTYVKNTFTPYFHPVGTCAIGRTNMSVVDSNLRVHGVSNLRVADASVMPSIPSNNTNATVYAIAERASDLLSYD